MKQSFVSRALVIAGFVVFGVASIACGGSKKPPEVPKNEASEAPRAGSTNPDPANGSKDGAPAAPAPAGAPAAAASSSADNGSDIVPPFPSSGPGKEKDNTAASGPSEKDPPVKKKGSRSGAKKNGGKSRKKG